MLFGFSNETLYPAAHCAHRCYFVSRSKHCTQQLTVLTDVILFLERNTTLFGFSNETLYPAANCAHRRYLVSRTKHCTQQLTVLTDVIWFLERNTVPSSSLCSQTLFGFSNETLYPAANCAHRRYLVSRTKHCTQQLTVLTDVIWFLERNTVPSSSLCSQTLFGFSNETLYPAANCAHRRYLVSLLKHCTQQLTVLTDIIWFLDRNTLPSSLCSQMLFGFLIETLYSAAHRAHRCYLLSRKRVQ
ncbi:unnamed protein product [Acanthosepion pharaonis]|uniref:Uncharacterized protein n=1 Tax=Acanthosepion pharaonis TaxID=158019 RepID=A0A812DDX0_ACAPH|nr:unnamed protein product [Sepia pharaonis]